MSDSGKQLGECRHAMRRDHCPQCLREDLQQAYQQLAYLWNQTGSCPCGARRESPNTHSHVTGCPTAAAVKQEGGDS